MEKSQRNFTDEATLEHMTFLLKQLEICLLNQDCLRKMSTNLDQEIENFRRSMAKFESLLSSLD